MTIGDAATPKQLANPQNGADAPLNVHGAQLICNVARE